VFFQELTAVSFHEREIEGPPGKAHDGNIDKLLFDVELEEGYFPVEEVLEDEDVRPASQRVFWVRRIQALLQEIQLSAMVMRMRSRTVRMALNGRISLMMAKMKRKTHQNRTFSPRRMEAITPTSVFGRKFSIG